MNGKMARRAAVASLVALVVAAFAASAAAGAAPIVLRFTVAETNPDEFLTQACGFPVETRVQGVVVFRIFDNDATGIVGVTTSDIGATAIAGDNTYRLPRSAGVDLLLTLPSGDRRHRRRSAVRARRRHHQRHQHRRTARRTSPQHKRRYRPGLRSAGGLNRASPSVLAAATQAKGRP